MKLPGSTRSGQLGTGCREEGLPATELRPNTRRSFAPRLGVTTLERREVLMGEEAALRAAKKPAPSRCPGHVPSKSSKLHTRAVFAFRRFKSEVQQGSIDGMAE